MSAYYPQQDSGIFSKRSLILLAIIAIHVIAIYIFAEGFAKNGKRYLATIMQTNIIQTEKPKDLPPPPPPVDLKERPPVQVIAPDININVPVDQPPPPITNTTTKPAPPPPVHAAPAPAPTKLAVAFTPDVRDYYPDSARRDGQEGRPQVKICINTSGKVDTAEVTTSSGFPALDQAAVKVGKAMKFKPPTQDGKPVAVCTILPVKFELHTGG